MVYPRTSVRAGGATVVAPVVPVGENPALAPGSPGWVNLSPDGSLTLTPQAEAREGIWRVTVQARSAGGATRYVVAEVDVETPAVPDAHQHEIDPWCEVSLSQGMRLRCAPVASDALWVPSPRLLPSLRVRMVYGDGSTDVADAALRLPTEHG